MALDKVKAKAAAKEAYELLHSRGLKYEEITMALMHMSAWDLAFCLDEEDLHRVPTYLWNWSKAMEFHVDEWLSERFKKWRDQKVQSEKDWKGPMLDKREQDEVTER